MKEELIYNLTVQSKYAVQKVHVGTKNLWAIQGHPNPIMIKMPIDGKRAVQTEKMQLVGTGHTQNCDYIEIDGHRYFMITVKPTPCKGQIRPFATQIGFVPFEKDGRIRSYLDVRRWCYMSLSSKIKVRRLECAISPNKQTLLAVVDRGDGIVYFHKISDLPTAIKQLFSYKKIHMPFMEVKKESKRMSRANWKKLLPYGSVQGIAYGNTGTIWIIGSNSDGKIRINKIRYKNGVFAIVGHFDMTVKGEAEGLQIKGEWLYFTVVKASDKRHPKVYRVKKEWF